MNHPITLQNLLNSDHDLLTVEEVAEALRVSDATVRRMISSKELSALKFSGTTRIYKSSLVALADKRCDHSCTL